jgi:hypothetical protein
MKPSRTTLALVSSAAGASVLALVPAAFPAQSPGVAGQPTRIVAGTPCAGAVRDQANPSSCLSASSVPELGSLFPLTEALNVQPVTGRVGIGTTFPFRSLEVVGDGAAVSNAAGSFRGLLRPSTNGLWGVLETMAAGTDLVPQVTNLVTSVSIDRKAGAIATLNGSNFLTLLTTPAATSNAGYLSVRSATAETAGINGQTGVVFGASKSFVQPHPTDASQEIQYVSLEGPEHGVYWRGSARLANGVAVLAAPESFRLVARADGLTVSVTPLGPSCGLYVAKKGLDGFEVRENEGGKGGGAIEFDFLVMGKRSAMPEHHPIRENRHFLPEPGTVIAEGELPGRYRELLIQNGTLEPDGRVSAASAALRARQAEHDGVAGEAALPARD